MVWRRVQGVQSHTQGGVDHVVHELSHQGAWSLQARISVHLDQVNLEAFVEHEVEAEDLKSVVLEGAGWRHHFLRRPKRICHDLLDLAEDVRPEVDLQVGVVLVQVTLVLLEGQFVALLIAAVVV